jgi:hypothetical protein
MMFIFICKIDTQIVFVNRDGSFDFPECFANKDAYS